MSRRTIAIAILAIWAGALGLLYHRTTNRSPEQALLEAGMRVSPATYYYLVTSDGQQVGAASSALDTTDTRIIATDFVRGAIPWEGDTVELEARIEARYTRGLRLRDFVMRVTGDFTPLMVRGVVQEGEDKTLRITSQSEGQRAITQEALLMLPAFIPATSPLPLMLAGKRKDGDTARVAVFDPLPRTLKEVKLEIYADSLFLVADSAHLDSASMRWVKARQDSLRGWRITDAGSNLIVWVDGEGRLIAASQRGGLSLVRTAFEIAFENWRLDRTPDPEPGGRYPGPGQR